MRWAKNPPGKEERKKERSSHFPSNCFIHNIFKSFLNVKTWMLASAKDLDLKLMQT